MLVYNIWIVLCCWFWIRIIGVLRLIGDVIQWAVIGIFVVARFARRFIVPSFSWKVRSSLVITDVISTVVIIWLKTVRMIMHAWLLFYLIFPELLKINPRVLSYLLNYSYSILTIELLILNSYPILWLISSHKETVSSNRTNPLNFQHFIKYLINANT